MTLIDLKAQAYDAIGRVDFHQSRLNEINRAIADASSGDDQERLKTLKAMAYDALAQVQAAQSEISQLNNMIRNYVDPSDTQGEEPGAQEPQDLSTGTNQ